MYFEPTADGSGFHEIIRGSQDAFFSCPYWTPDGKYLIYRVLHPRADVWMLPVQRGFSRRFKQPIQLTNGPLSYSIAVPSLDGRKIFAVGTAPRGELVRYDMNMKGFVPFLGGISAIEPSFSRDGQWVALHFLLRPHTPV